MFALWLYKCSLLTVLEEMSASLFALLSSGLNFHYTATIAEDKPSAGTDNSA